MFLSGAAQRRLKVETVVVGEDRATKTVMMQHLLMELAIAVLSAKL